MAVAEKPGVLERLGGALNSSDLSPIEDRIGAVELIGALAYTQTNPGALVHVGIEAAVIDPRTELASVLVRLKYAGDRVLGERAVGLLVHWVHHQKAFRKWKLKAGGDGLLQRFVRQGLAEWLYPVCQVCSGREFLGAEKGRIIEKRVRCTRCTAGFVTLAKNGVRKQCLGCGGSGWRTHRRVSQSKMRECPTCMGSGRHRPNDSERSNALGIEHKVYQRHWVRRFDWLAAGLDRLDHLEKNCLVVQVTS